MDQVLIPLKELARDATIPQLKYWAKLLGILLIVRGRIAHVSNDDAQKLLKVAELVKEGKSPQDAVNAVGPMTNAVIVPDEDESTLGFLGLKEEVENLGRRNEGIEKVLMAMVEEIKGLRKENNALKAYLMPPQEPPKQVIPWQPEAPKNPLDGMSWLQRAYVQVVEPWRLRRYDS